MSPLMFVLVAVMIIFLSLQSLFSRFQANEYPGDSNTAPIAFSFWYGLLIAFITFLSTGFKINPSMPTILLGILDAAVVLGYNVCLLSASDRGSYAITMIFMIFGGILVPLLSSVLFLGDSITAVQLIAIIVMLVSFILMNKPDKKEEKKQGNKSAFLLLCVLLLIFNGLYGTIVDFQQTVMKSTESKEMVAVIYITLPIFSLAYLLIKSKGNVKSVTKKLKQTKKSALYLVLAGVAGTVTQNVLLYGVGVFEKAGVSSGIYYTFDNGGAMIMSIVYAAVIFKEKLNKYKFAGMILAILALVVLGI